MKEYDREKAMWNQVFSDYQLKDITHIPLMLEPMFDTCLMLFAESTSRVLDFGCGTGDILFQCAQCHHTDYGLGIDSAGNGIDYAREMAELNHFTTLEFAVGDENSLEQYEESTFNGIILSNVLDVMPKENFINTLKRLDHLLCPGGYWFIKLNPFYSDEELSSFQYQPLGEELYEADGVLCLRQEPTYYWKKVFRHLGTILRYLEFPYPWQPGQNRLFLLKKAFS